jgi:hypothetical protein
VRPPDSQGVDESVEIAGFHLAAVRAVTLRDCTVRVTELRNEGFQGESAPAPDRK